MPVNSVTRVLPFAKGDNSKWSPIVTFVFMKIMDNRAIRLLSLS